MHGSPRHFLCNDASLLKMIGKGFVLLRINNSPSAFFIIKPTCISWLVFKMGNCFEKLSKSSNPKLCLCWWHQLRAESKHWACLYSRTVLNLIFGTLSAQFKFNNNVERFYLHSWFIHGRITAAAGLWHMSIASTQSSFTLAIDIQIYIVKDKLMKNLSTYGRRVFSFACPAAWNCLCDELHEPLLTANSFRQLLKTRLFAEY